MDTVFVCAACGEENSIFVDPSGGAEQGYVEDCQVCCRPNVLSIHWNEWEEIFEVHSQVEGME